jgi:hypothetical protein
MFWGWGRQGMALAYPQILQNKKKKKKELKKKKKIKGIWLCPKNKNTHVVLLI